MGRLVSLLLIPWFVLGSEIPHSHADNGAPLPNGHAARPHVHFSHAHLGSHGHPEPGHHPEPVDDHGPERESSAVPLDHDADAIYLLDAGEYLAPANPLKCDKQVRLLTVLPHLSDSPLIAVPRPAIAQSFLPHYGPPIFLWVAALRL